MSSLSQSLDLVPSSCGFHIARRPIEGGVELELSGRLTFDETQALWNALRPEVERAQRGAALNFDLAGVKHVDGGAMAVLAHLRTELQQSGVRSEFVRAPQRIQEIVHMYRGDVRVGRARRRRPRGMLDQLGAATAEIVIEAQQVLAFLGQMLLSAIAVIRRPRTGNWRDVAPTMERTGADAVPIVLLINFLVGIVIAFQSAMQLKRFGATNFLAALVGLSVTRELGPLMTAIVMCGRSGAAFAAELGSMRVNEEIDALRTMGLGQMRYLVLPRVVALMLVMPLLTLAADVVGITGGMAVGVLSLDLSASGFLNATQEALLMSDVVFGLIKSVVFALAMGLVACQQGLATTGGAEGVGRRTTSAVVTTLFMLILLDAVFAVLFHVYEQQ
jgi:phospholipid/cholesterol/gamma-HCH transport system permease protein